MATKRTKDPAGLLGDLITIDLQKPEAGDMQAIIDLFEKNTPQGRLAALQKIPQLKARAEELSRLLVVRGGDADPQLLEMIASEETAAVYLRAAPKVIRDNKRQAGTRQPKRPEISDWIAQALERDPTAKAPELWSKAPDWITDALGEHAFKKRVTAERKKRRK